MIEDAELLRRYHRGKIPGRRFAELVAASCEFLFMPARWRRVGRDGPFGGRTWCKQVFTALARDAGALAKRARY